MTTPKGAGKLIARVLLPMVCLAVSLAGGATCAASTVTLRWNPSTGTDVAGYKVYYKADSSVAPFNGTGAAQGSSPVDVARQTGATISGLDPAHAYSFAVTAYSSAGVESPYSNVATVAELAPPSATISYPANNATVGGTVSVTAQASDNAGVSRVEFYVNGVLKGTDTGSPYLYSWNTASLAPGTYTLIARAYDAAGNQGESPAVSVTVANDSTPPVVSLTSPAANATVSGTVALRASASDNVGVARVEFYDNGVLLSASNVAPYAYNWNTASSANGSHLLSARAYDAAGNAGLSGNLAVTVLNDAAAPVVSLSSPAADAVLGGTVQVSARASDDVGVTRVEFYLNGVLKTTLTGAPYSFSWDTATVANGAYLLDAKGYDAAGRVGQAASVRVVVFNDATAPQVAIGSLKNGATVAGTVEVSVGASDDAGVARVEFYVDGALQSTLTAAPYDFSWRTLQLPDGYYQLSARAYDAAGNVGRSQTVTALVRNDTTAPALSINPVGAPVAGSPLLLSGTVGGGDVASVTVQVGSGPPLEAALSGGGWSLQLAGLAAGDYPVTVRAADLSGNSSAASATITVQDAPGATPPGFSLEDVVAALNYASGNATPSAAELERLDVAPYLEGAPRPNGIVDTGDVVVILQKLVGKL